MGKKKAEDMAYDMYQKTGNKEFIGNATYDGNYLRNRNTKTFHFSLGDRYDQIFKKKKAKTS